MRTLSIWWNTRTISKPNSTLILVCNNSTATSPIEIHMWSLTFPRINVDNVLLNMGFLLTLTWYINSLLIFPFMSCVSIYFVKIIPILIFSLNIIPITILHPIIVVVVMRCWSWVVRFLFVIKDLEWYSLFFFSLKLKFSPFSMLCTY